MATTTTSYGSITITEVQEGSQIWTTTVSPSFPSYTFTVSNLIGDSNASVKVGDIIMYSYYRYTVLSVSADGTTVFTGNRQGFASTVYQLIVSPVTVVKDKNGIYSPYYITLTAKSKTGTNTMGNYHGRFRIETTTDNENWEIQYTSTLNEPTVELDFSELDDIVALRCSLYASGGTSTLLDQQVISVVTDGVDGNDAYTVILTNENHTFAGNTTSAIASEIECNIIAYKGTTQVAATIGTITGQPTGMTTSLLNNGTVNAAFRVSVTSSMVTKNGVLNVPITVDNKVFTKKFTYGLALDGEDGKDGGRWYSGTSITGTSTTATVFSGSGISSAVIGDMYLNTSTYNTYRCTLGGDASTAKWVYVNNIKGVHGDTGKGVSSITNQYYLSTSNTTQTGGSWSSTVPPYVEDCYYWTKSHIVWTDNTETDTTAVLDNGLTDANANAIDARKVATNYLAVDNTGIMVADMEYGEQTPSGILTGKNVFIDSDSVEIREGQNTLSSFGSNSIVLGQKSKSRLELTTSSIKGISNQGVINFDITGQNIDGDGTLNDSGVLVNQATDEDRENGILFKATFRPNLNLNNYDSLTGSINFIFNNNERTYNQTYNFSYDVPDSEPWVIVLPHEETISSIAHYKYGVDMLGSYYTFTFVDLGSQSDIIVDDTVSYNISITSTDYHDSSFSFGSRATSLLDDYSVGSNSCIIGEELVATSANQVAIGRYNYDNTERYPNELNRRYAFMVGNGFLGAGRNNAFAVDWDGRVETGDIKATGLLLEENSKSEMDDYIKCVSAGDADIFKVNKNGIINAAGRINAPNANFVKPSSNNADYIQCGDTDNNVNFQVLHDGSVIVGNDLLVGNSQTVTNNLTVGGNETITGNLTVSGTITDTSSNYSLIKNLNVGTFKLSTRTPVYRKRFYWTAEIGANSGWARIGTNASLDGYTPVGVVSFGCFNASSGASSNVDWCVITKCYVWSSTLDVYVWNQNTGASARCGVYVDVLYFAIGMI